MDLTWEAPQGVSVAELEVVGNRVQISPSLLASETGSAVARRHPEWSALQSGEKYLEGHRERLRAIWEGVPEKTPDLWRDTEKVVWE